MVAAFVGCASTKSFGPEDRSPDVPAQHVSKRKPCMSEVKTWNPWESWKPVTVKWIKVDINKEDMARFTRRSNVLGLCQAIPFLLLFAVTGFLAYHTFVHKHYVLFAMILLVHGTFYGFFGSALHELSHNTVFSSRFLNK